MYRLRRSQNMSDTIHYDEKAAKRKTARMKKKKAGPLEPTERNLSNFLRGLITEERIGILRSIRLNTLICRVNHYSHTRLLYSTQILTSIIDLKKEENYAEKKKEWARFTIKTTFDPQVYEAYKILDSIYRNEDDLTE